MVGKKFGKLTIIRLAPKPRGRKNVICRCDCGKERHLNYYEVKSGRRVSCGSHTCSYRNRYDLTGKHFGRLRVISLANSRNGRRVWHCRCSCGNFKNVSTDLLVSKQTRSCGCLRVHHIDESTFIMKAYLSKYKAGAAKRNLEFNLTPKEFLLLVKGNCFYCGRIPLRLKESYFRNRMGFDVHVGGIDRVDPRYGYNVNNCVSCCKYCNRAKLALSQDDFFDMVKRIATKHNLVGKQYNPLTDKQLEPIMEPNVSERVDMDAPPCPNCGSLMTSKNGTCHGCPNCGQTSGCS